MGRGGSAWLALALTACGGEGSPPEPGGPDAAAAPNDSFETAHPVQVGASAGVQTSIVRPDQRDFYRFEASAGEWLALSTNDGRFSPDATITLYDAERRPIAENDEGSIWPGDAFDARIVTRVTATGTYYATVEDRETPSEVLLTGPERFYRFTVFVLDEGLPALDFEEGAGDAGRDAASAKRLALDPVVDERPDGVSRITILGDFGAPDDVDVFAFEAPAPLALVATFQPSGELGSGSTTPAGQVWITDPAATEILARIDQSSGQHSIRPPLEAGEYRLWVSHPPGGAGDNDFYTVDLALVPENPPERADLTNGDFAGAEPLFDGLSPRAFVLAHLPPGDLDTFRIALPPEASVSVTCSSRTNGSSLVDLQVDLMDSAGNEFATAVEGPNRLTIDEAYPATSGDVFLRLSSRARLSSVSGDWARCAAYLFRR